MLTVLINVAIVTATLERHRAIAVGTAVVYQGKSVWLFLDLLECNVNPVLRTARRMVFSAVWLMVATAAHVHLQIFVYQVLLIAGQEFVEIVLVISRRIVRTVVIASVLDSEANIPARVEIA